jgi:hypothetical protein
VQAQYQFQSLPPCAIFMQIHELNGGAGASECSRMEWLSHLQAKPPGIFAGNATLEIRIADRVKIT